MRIITLFFAKYSYEEVDLHENVSSEVKENFDITPPHLQQKNEVNSTSSLKNKIIGTTSIVFKNIVK